MKMISKFDNFKLNRLIIPTILLLCACVIEVVVFNFSSIKTIGLAPISIGNEYMIDKEEYVLEVNNICKEVKNIYLQDVLLKNCNSFNVELSLTDAGDKYEYALPEFRVVQGVESTGYVNIYPYGKVNSIKVKVSLPEGAGAYIGNISINVNRPFDIKPIRIFILFVILCLFECYWGKDRLEILNLKLRKRDNKQLIITIMSVLLVLFIGRWMSTCNEMIVRCPWPHHKQYQELAVSLSQGTVKLDKAVDDRLLISENPYDTIALTVEEIPFNMDYAYYKGGYYVYFGIIPELLLYYPYYIVTGGILNNYNAQLILYVFLVLAVFFTVKRLFIRYGDKNGECNIPFLTYILASIATSLFSNYVYLISRADIYNIPIMAANAFTWMGIGLWLYSLEINDYKGVRCISIFFGSLCMACVAGCRPQMVLYSAVAIFLFIFVPGDGARLGIAGRKIFVKGRLTDTIVFCLPYIIVAVIVCWYNQARFDSIFEFGATLSLTTNDMNNRGFNLDRLFRGLYAFFFQPMVISLDFPYLESSIIDSSYMGKNLTEFTYGGYFATNLALISIFAPLFGLYKKMSNEQKGMYFTFVIGSIIIAAFDVNGAGILYRYMCDFTVGIVLASALIWIILLKEYRGGNRIVDRLLLVTLLIGLMYSLLVLLGRGDSVNLKAQGMLVYEHIREYFRI